LDSRYENITNAQALVGLIVSQALMRTSLRRIADLDVAGLASQVAGQAGNAAHTLTETGKGVVGGATGAVKKGSDALKKLLSPE